MTVGERTPYVIFGMNEQDYLTLGRYWQDVLRYLEQMKAVVQFYRAEQDILKAE